MTSDETKKTIELQVQTICTEQHSAEICQAADVQMVCLPKRVREVIQGLYRYFSDDEFLDALGQLRGMEEIYLGMLLQELGEWLDSLSSDLPGQVPEKTKCVDEREQLSQDDDEPF